LQFGSNPYTIEGWVYQNARSTTQWICGGTFSGTGYQFGINSSGFIFGSVPGVGDLTAATTAISLNTWTHFAIVRTSTSSNGVAYYINGAAAGTATDSSNISGTATALNIATTNNNTSVSPFNGYISNLRVTNGRAVYSGAFTPSTVPLTATTGGTNPPTGTQCTLLTCQSNRFKDNSAQATPATLTPTGTPQVDPYFYPSGFTAPAASPGAALFNGTSQYLTAGTSAALNPGAGNFTFECWIYATSTPTSSAIFSGNTNGLGVSFNSSQLGVSQTGVAFIITDPASFTLLNQWVHVAVVRSGTTLSLYKNGSRVATTAASSTNFVTSTQTFIASNGTTQFPGYIANLRLINGGATVYDPTQTTITIPTSPVTATANTVLLLNLADSNYNSATNLVQNNTFIDTGPYAFPITRNGTPTQGSITPYWPNGQWSNYFAGSQSISAPASSSFQFAGDFTIECWIFRTTTGDQTTYIQTNGTTYFALNVNAGTGLNIYLNSATASIAATDRVPALNVWNHVALVRSGSGS
jgi:hypothetical protein